MQRAPPSLWGGRCRDTWGRAGRHIHAPQLAQEQFMLNSTCLPAHLHACPPPRLPTSTQFTLDCRPFYVAGFNVDNIAQAAVAAVARKAGTSG